MAAGVTVYTVQTTNTILMSTELGNGSGLASGSYVQSTQTFNNSPQTIGSVSPTANMGGYLRAVMILHLGQFGTAPASNGSINLWFLRSIDGTTFEDGATTPRAADIVVPVESQNTAAQNISADIILPAGVWKLLAQNNTSQALASSGNTITVQPYTAGE